MANHAEDEFNFLASIQLFVTRQEFQESKDFIYTGLKTLNIKTFTDHYTHKNDKISNFFTEYNIIREQSQNYKFRFKLERPVESLEYSTSVYSNMDKEDIVRIEQAIIDYYPKTQQTYLLTKKLKNWQTYIEHSLV